MSPIQHVGQLNCWYSAQILRMRVDTLGKGIWMERLNWDVNGRQATPIAAPGSRTAFETTRLSWTLRTGSHSIARQSPRYFLRRWQAVSVIRLRDWAWCLQKCCLDFKHPDTIATLWMWLNVFLAMSKTAYLNVLIKIFCSYFLYSDQNVWHYIQSLKILDNEILVLIRRKSSIPPGHLKSEYSSCQSNFTTG